MLILQSVRNDKEHPEISIVAVFGLGLIGTHLIEILYQQQYKAVQYFPFSWQIPLLRGREKTDICDYIRQLLKSIPSPTSFAGQCPDCWIDFVWSAGKAGFAVKANDTAPEMDSFCEVVEIANAVKRENPFCRVRFHMISSAGGLFEGQRHVSTTTKPAPRRPYGSLKLKQEEILESCTELIRFIYRPTSVYGFAGLDHRLGLIPTLLWNGLQNKVSTLFGAPETMRDYVWVDDIGAFIAVKIASKKSCPGHFILASGKPSALFEILNRIEKVLNKRLFCHYVKSGSNAEHNTFFMQTHPAGWNPLDLETGIIKTYHTMFQKGII